MTPEQITKILRANSVEHLGLILLPSHTFVIVAQEISEALEEEKTDSVKMGVELLRYAECLDGIDDDVASLAISLMPPDGVGISMADLTVGIQKIKDSLSQLEKQNNVSDHVEPGKGNKVVGAATESVAGEIPHVPCELNCYTHPKVQCGCSCHKKSPDTCVVECDNCTDAFVAGRPCDKTCECHKEEKK